MPKIIRRYFYGVNKSKINEKYFQINGKKEDKSIEYLKKGQVDISYNYVNNKKNGNCKNYYENCLLDSTVKCLS
jgi:antitoxin component YwqK of YwqJK toxin-antitoxin module